MICFIRNRDNYTLRKRLPYFSAFTGKALTALIAVLCISSLCHGQDAGTASDSGEEEIRPLEIGDTIPEALWNLPLQVVNHPEGKDTITLNDYRDKKLIILDFWATWCAPCIKSLRNLDNIQQEFEEDLWVLPSSIEDVELVKNKFEKENFSLMSAFEQIPLRKYFPCRFLPHQVWISDNKVFITTNGESSTHENLSRFLTDKEIDIEKKDDIFFKPFTFIDTYATERNAPLISKSIVTGYISGLGGSGSRKNDTLQTYYFFNRPLIEIIKNTLSVPYNRILITDKKQENWLVNKKFKREYVYCYQLFSDISENEGSIRRKMLADLSSAFNLEIEYQQRLINSYILSEIKDQKTIVATNKRYPINSLIAMLNHSVEWGSDLMVFLDETEHQFYLPEKPANTTIDKWRADPDKLKEALNKIGLTITKKNRVINMLVISPAQDELPTPSLTDFNKRDE